MQLKIEKGTFTNHSLEDIASALKKGLSENFKNVEVEVVVVLIFVNGIVHLKE